MENKRIPYNQPVDHRFIKYVRVSRNKTLLQFEEYMKIDKSTIAKLEHGQLEFTEHYEAKFKDAIKRLRVSNAELIHIRELINAKNKRGYK